MDDLDAFERMCMELDHRRIEKQKKLLMRLNKAELFVLAKHYKLKPEYFTDGWQGGGKAELCLEIAELMD